MTRTALEPYVKDLTAKQPFMQEQINVTNPRQFLDSILPYMVKQKVITEEKREWEKLYIRSARIENQKGYICQK